MTINRHIGSIRFFADSREHTYENKETDSQEVTIPLGLKLAKEFKDLPHNQSATHKSTATNKSTPRGDSTGDVGYDVDY